MGTGVLSKVVLELQLLKCSELGAGRQHSEGAGSLQEGLQEVGDLQGTA